MGLFDFMKSKRVKATTSETANNPVVTEVKKDYSPEAEAAKCPAGVWDNQEQWSDMDADSQIKVIRSVKDQKLLVEILRATGTVWQAEDEISKRLTDVGILEQVAVDSELPDSVRIAAVEKISDPTIFRQLASSDYEAVRIAAFQKLSFVDNEELFFETALDTSLPYRIRVPVIKKIKDKTMLFEIALKEDDDVEIVTLALSKLKDSDKNIEVAKNADWWAARKITVKDFISDKNILKEIAENDEDESVRTAAEEKMKK